MEITYTRQGDYLLPNLTLPDLLVKFSMKKKKERVSRCCQLTRSLSLFRDGNRHQFSCSCLNLCFDRRQSLFGQVD